ncbi:MAG: hypothetical protein M3Y87_26500 [Myxococcota bacterium]|nr:hypothetical protein [Myxococcota bacterium]
MYELPSRPSDDQDEAPPAAVEWVAPPASASRPVRGPVDPLRGEAAAIEGKGAFAMVEALLKSPASVLHEIRHGRGALFQLSAIVVITMALTGLVMAAFGGGLQLLIVPLKLSLGIFFCAAICFPSLHVFSCLAGAQQSARETWGALMMAVALMGVLLVGFAPVAWVFSQATSSPVFMGALHLTFLLISSVFAIGLLSRALAAMNAAPVRGTTMWGVLFVLVMCQVTTTLRPLVGPFDGTLFHDRLFFLAYWVGGG